MRRFFFFAGLFLVLFGAGAALADQIWVKRAVLPANGASALYCFGQAGARGGINCTEAVRIAYGTKLSDGGTWNVSDAGQPLVASPTDEFASFPGSEGLNYKIALGLGIQCIALKTESNDAGTCDIYGQVSSP